MNKSYAVADFVWVLMLVPLLALLVRAACFACLARCAFWSRFLALLAVLAFSLLSWMNALAEFNIQLAQHSALNTQHGLHKLHSVLNAMLLGIAWCVGLPYS